MITYSCLCVGPLGIGVGRIEAIMADSLSWLLLEGVENVVTSPQSCSRIVLNYKLKTSALTSPLTNPSPTIFTHFYIYLEHRYCSLCIVTEEI